MPNKHNEIQLTERRQVVTYELPIIQQGENLIVEARIIHQKLKSKQKFSDWIKNRIADYGFKENEDFFLILGKSTGGRKAQEYLLTLDTAKEIAMVERNEIGRQIRKYFIQKEKELRGISQLPKESQLFKGLKVRRINGRPMYPYREIIRRCGYSLKSSSAQRKAKYWMHFVLDGALLYITEEFATHLHHSRQVTVNRATMLATQPVLPFSFGDVSQLSQGGSHV